MKQIEFRTFLVIQTAFIGDVILATAVLEKLHLQFPDSQIDFLVRKGNESLLRGHPFINRVLIWDKKEGKLRNLIKLAKEIRARHYDVVVNVHRFASSGLITSLSGAPQRIGFKKNPFSFLFTHSLDHVIAEGVHEINRNQKLIEHLTGSKPAFPKLYPSAKDVESIKRYQFNDRGQKKMYVTLAPTSVWFTKQMAREKWAELIKRLPETMNAYLLGAGNDREACAWIAKTSGVAGVTNLAGELSFLQSAALMQGAAMNYVNDSAPMHLTSAVNAPVTAVYCSTVPSFGFGPLNENSHIIQTTNKLDCRPCGLHGHRQCPKGHFKCSSGISVGELINVLPAPVR